jgi:hypothetical protein
MSAEYEPVAGFPVREEEAPTEDERLWVAFGIAIGKIKKDSVLIHPTGELEVVIERKPGHLIVVLVSAADFFNVIQAPVGRWFAR